MSDIADAVFGGQLLGHIIAGEELTSSVISDAALEASMAEGFIAGNGELSNTEHQILEAKVAQQTASEGEYMASDIMQDHLEMELDASIADSFSFPE